MYMFIFLLNVNLFCFIRQLSLNFTNMFLLIYFSFGARLLLLIVGDLITSSDNPLNAFSITNFLKIFAHRLEY